MSIESLEDRRLLAVVTVNSALDVVDVSSSAEISNLPGADGVVSLREAIIAANNSPGSDEIEFDTFGTFSQPRTIALDQGRLSVTSDVVINGPEVAQLTISALGSDWVFVVDDLNSFAHSTVELNHLTIADGLAFGIFSREQLTINDSVISGTNGEGIRQTYGELTVANSRIEFNSTYGLRTSRSIATIVDSEVSGNAHNGVVGGGDQGLLTITRSRITGNGHADVGITYGGIYSMVDTIVEDSLVAGNSTTGSGGGIRFRNATLDINNSTLSGNFGARGGGLYLYSDGDVTLSNSTVSGNIASVGGGGLYNRGYSLFVENSTVTKNVAPANTGGGISVGGTQLDSTIIRSSIVSGNTNGDVHTNGSVFNLESFGHNLIGNGNAASRFYYYDQTGITDPRLRALAYGGGLVPTHAPLPDSAALNAGTNPFGIEFDQRGFPFARDDGQGVDVGAFELQALPVQPLIVDTVVDELDGDYSAGDLSVREAIALANGSSSTETIAFDSLMAFASPETITLTLGQLHIAGDMTIDGNSANGLTLDADGDSRVFLVDAGLTGPGAAVEIHGVTITGGAFPDSGSGQGGGISNLERLKLRSVNVEGNSSSNDGGGISNQGTLELLDSRVSGNDAAGLGGGIYSDGLLTIGHSTISNNSAHEGGGVYSNDQMTVVDSTISNNSADRGGGIYSFANGVVTNSTISGNTASQNGGGIDHRYGALQIRYSTVTSNEAVSTRGSGIYIGTTHPSSLLLSSSIVSGNANRDIDHQAYFINRITSDGFNLIGMSDELAGFIPSDMTGVIDPRLGILADNGGPTETHAPLPGSPALDAGDPEFASPPVFDQRGAPFVRVANGRIDIGSVETAVDSSCVVAGDLDCSGQVGAADLNLVLNHWGADSDVKGVPIGWVHDLPNGIISAEELNRVLNNWGNSAAVTTQNGLDRTRVPISSMRNEDLSTDSAIRDKAIEEMLPGVWRGAEQQLSRGKPRVVEPFTALHARSDQKLYTQRYEAQVDALSAQIAAGVFDLASEHGVLAELAEVVEAHPWRAPALVSSL